MVKGIIEKTHIISSKVTKFIWLLGYNNFSKMDMYFKTEGVYANAITRQLKMSLHLLQFCAISNFKDGDVHLQLRP